MPPAEATHTRAPSVPSPASPAPPDPTHLPRPDTFDPDLYRVIEYQARVVGRPELADLNRADDRPGWNATLAFHLAMMVQTLAWCHGTDRGGSPRLTGSTIDGRHFVKASHTDWASVCPDLTEKTVRRVLAVGVGKLPSGRRAGGLAITRRGGRGFGTVA